MKDPELWQKIDAFKLDKENSEFTFSNRLTRDNKWNYEFSCRVINEYKRFMYLCCVGYGEITPSDSVDQAWHLHLTYTKSYWIQLCKQTLNRQIHHNPTKGGNIEREKYSSCYDAIFDAYFAEFGSKPPKDIWPDNKKRFSNINFKRINVSEYWLIKKPGLPYSIVLIPASLLIAGLFIQSENSIPWFSFILCFIFLLIIIRTIRGGRKGGKKRGGDSNNGCSFWGGFWGCSSDHSGCSSHGCSSGCGGCGGGD